LAIQSGNQVAWTYTDDNGQEYKRAAKLALVTQLGVSEAPKVGGVSGVAVIVRFPRTTIKPRCVIVKNAAGLFRRVVCYAADSELFTGIETTITLVLDGTGAEFTRWSAEGERIRRGIGQST